jgi:hypothetical protein
MVIRLVQRHKYSDIRVFSSIGDMFRPKPVGITLLKLTFGILFELRIF